MEIVQNIMHYFHLYQKPMRPLTKKSVETAKEAEPSMPSHNIFIPNRDLIVLVRAIFISLSVSAATIFSNYCDSQKEIKEILKGYVPKQHVDSLNVKIDNLNRNIDKIKKECDSLDNENFKKGFIIEQLEKEKQDLSNINNISLNKVEITNNIDLSNPQAINKSLSRNKTVAQRIGSISAPNTSTLDKQKVISRSESKNWEEEAQKIFEQANKDKTIADNSGNLSTKKKYMLIALKGYQTVRELNYQKYNSLVDPKIKEIEKFIDQPHIRNY